MLTRKDAFPSDPLAQYSALLPEVICSAPGDKRHMPRNATTYVDSDTAACYDAASLPTEIRKVPDCNMLPIVDEKLLFFSKSLPVRENEGLINRGARKILGLPPDNVPTPFKSLRCRTTFESLIAHSCLRKYSSRHTEEWLRASHLLPTSGNRRAFITTAYGGYIRVMFAARRCFVPTDFSTRTHGIVRRLLLTQRRLASNLTAEQIPQVPPPSSLTPGQTLATFRIVLDYIRHGVSGTRLELIGTDATIDVQDKWSRAMQVLVGAQAHCAAAFGYEASAQGVTQFRTHIAQSAQRSTSEMLEDIRSIEADVWAEILLRGFAVAPRSIALKEARAFAARVLTEVSNLEPLGEEDLDKFAKLSQSEDGDMRALQTVQRTVFDVQQKVAPDFGFEGDGGYAQLQTAMINHMADPVVLESTKATMQAICQRAKIKASRDRSHLYYPDHADVCKNAQGEEDVGCIYGS